MPGREIEDLGVDLRSAQAGWAPGTLSLTGRPFRCYLRRHGRHTSQSRSARGKPPPWSGRAESDVRPRGQLRACQANRFIVLWTLNPMVGDRACAVPKREAVPGRLMIRGFRPEKHDRMIALREACGLTTPWNNPVEDIARKCSASPDLFYVPQLEGRNISFSGGNVS